VVEKMPQPLATPPEFCEFFLALAKQSVVFLVLGCALADFARAVEYRTQNELLLRFGETPHDFSFHLFTPFLGLVCLTAT
jgi:hypothetical protein